MNAKVPDEAVPVYAGLPTISGLAWPGDLQLPAPLFPLTKSCDQHLHKSL